MKGKGLLETVLPARSRQRAMRIHPLTLSFPPELEQEFSRRSFENSLPQIRLAIILGGILYSLFGVLDAVLVPLDLELGTEIQPAPVESIRRHASVSTCYLHSNSPRERRIAK